VPAKPMRSQDRRQINVASPAERRGTAPERRRCPECKSALAVTRRAVAGGTVTTLSCNSCDWTQSSRQTDADLLLAKMSWSLTLEKKPGGLQLSFPAELAEALKARPGDELLLAPLTLPVGSLPMRWALTLKRKKPGKG
jgi:hypothetical protein